MLKQLSLFEKIKSFPKKREKQKTSITDKRNQGNKAEDLSCEFLKKQGLSLLEKNFNIRAGEIDLIMVDKKEPDMLIFIEVRYRKNTNYGGAAASITAKKQQRIIKAALTYQQKHAPQSSMRFDVIAVEGDMKIDWIKSAFDGF